MPRPAIVVEALQALRDGLDLVNPAQMFKASNAAVAEETVIFDEAQNRSVVLTKDGYTTSGAKRLSYTFTIYENGVVAPARAGTFRVYIFNPSTSSYTDNQAHFKAAIDHFLQKENSFSVDMNK